ncbi:LPS export ABC transporter periplasmic protein LptC [Candidatus Babeliales bacterium]|nr:LPS export ABC transporter periplasmic protein LptC [Candidatus Babeliales bacterium]
MCVIKKKTVLRAVFAIFLFAGLPSFVVGLDPFSKITITSQQMRCYPAPNQKKAFTFDYQENVKATFADQSFITANLLSVIFDTKKTLTGDDTSKNQLSQFQSIIFEGNVKVVRQKNTVTADKAEVLLVNNTCRFLGNVRVEQHDPKMPMVLTSNCAFLNLKTDVVTFSGSQVEPVSTTINLEKHAATTRERRLERIRKKRLKKGSG